METAATIAMVCEGDAQSPGGAFSGSAYSMLVHLRQLGHEVWTIDTRLPKAARAWLACRTYAASRERWRSRFRHSGATFSAKSKRARQLFDRSQQGADIVLQIGPGSQPPRRRDMPYALYCDWNFSLAIQDRSSPYSAAHALSERQLNAINRQHAAVYRGAAALFTISERLRRSFIDDYGLPPERVVTASAGPNIDLELLVPSDRSTIHHAPTILFIGKEFGRKGGEVLLEAFARVRDAMPAAVLIVAGPQSMSRTPPGVEFVGYLRKDNPAEFERLLDAYRRADVFCLPSRQDPFPTVLREAMFFALPCVTTDRWAMPEMVVDGQTGYTVPPDEPEILAHRLCRLLGDRALARKMGEAGRRRAHERYTWSAAARTMHDVIQQIVK